MNVYLSLLVCLIGALVYLLAARGPQPNTTAVRVLELGRLMFWVGLLVFLLTFASVHYTFPK